MTRSSPLLLSLLLCLAACGGRAIDEIGKGSDPGDQTLPLPSPSTERKGVYIVTDSERYPMYGKVVATIVNATEQPIWVEGCSAFLLQQRVRDGWVDRGAPRYCRYASVPRRIRAGGQFSETLLFDATGSWRVRSRYATSCVDGSAVAIDPTRCSVRYARSESLTVAGFAR